MGALNKIYTLLKVTSVSGCECVLFTQHRMERGLVGGGEAERTTHLHPSQGKGAAEFPLAAPEGSMQAMTGKRTHF